MSPCVAMDDGELANPESPDSPESPEEVVDGLPVLAEVRPLQPVAPAMLPAVRVAAAAATGFLAGVTTFALFERRGARRLARAHRAVSRPQLDVLPVLGSRTYLVHVRVLAKPGE